MTTIELGGALAVERLLVVWPAYSATKEGEAFRDGGAVSNWLARTLASRRSEAVRYHVRIHRDFYANPRSAAYMAKLAGDALGRRHSGRITVLADRDLNIGRTDAPWAEQFVLAKHRLCSGEVDIHAQADAVLLLHPDPLGMGLGRLERKLLMQFPGKVYVLNGRQRAYRLDQRMVRVLRRHRFVAETRIVEKLLALLLPMCGMLLSFYDRVARRDQKS